MQDSNRRSQRQQDGELRIKINSNDNPYPIDDIQQKFKQPRRLSSYLVVLVEEGSITYKLDLQEITLTDGQLLFAMPNQIFIPPYKSDNIKYFKILFDDITLALLPHKFHFLVNPLNAQAILLDNAPRERVKKVFEILDQLLRPGQQPIDTEIVLTYLNTLLSELNIAYFKTNESIGILNTNISKFIEFKLVVETHLSEHPSINAIAAKMDLSTNSLYRIVKEHSGKSPKDFFTDRLIIEAQRKLRYSNISVKELAYDLGFNDPGYFSRLFKKCTGKSVREFVPKQDLSSD